MKLVVCFFSILLLFSCGKSENKKLAASSEVSSFGSLNNQILASSGWKSDCHFDKEKGYFVSYEDEYLNGGYKWTTRYFMRKNCKKLAAIEVLRGSYQLGATLDEKNRVIEFDYKIDSLEVTFLVKAQVKHLNRANYCGRSDWKTGESILIDHGECGLPDKKEQTIYSSISVHSDSVYYPSGDEGDTPETRNSAIDWDLKYSQRP